MDLFQVAQDSWNHMRGIAFFAIKYNSCHIFLTETTIRIVQISGVQLTTVLGYSLHSCIIVRVKTKFYIFLIVLSLFLPGVIIILWFVSKLICAYLVGFKYQRITLFATGCSSAALLTYLICLERSSLAVHYVLLITAALGIFGGILCTTVIFCGLFTSGIVAGFSVAITFLFGLASLDVYQSISVPIGVLIGISVVVAGANVWWKRVVLILTSSIYGAALIAGGLDYFVEDLRLLHHVWEKVLLFEITGRLCFFSWITFGVWPLMCLIGLLVQFLKTGKKPSKPKKGENHRRNRSSRNERSHPVWRCLEMTRDEFCLEHKVRKFGNREVKALCLYQMANYSSWKLLLVDTLKLFLNFLKLFLNFNSLFALKLQL